MDATLRVRRAGWFTGVAPPIAAVSARCGRAVPACRAWLVATCLAVISRRALRGEGVDHPTVVGMIEPFLLRAGLIKRGSRGRMATPAAYQHLGLTAPITLAWVV